MKKSLILINFVILGIIIAGSSFSSGRNNTVSFGADQDTLRSYKDGAFSGKSQDTYTDEPYWGFVSVTLKNGSFTGVSFSIKDTALNENFDTLYAKHFDGNELYIQQCRDDWKGVQISLKN